MVVFRTLWDVPPLSQSFSGAGNTGEHGPVRQKMLSIHTQKEKRNKILSDMKRMNPMLLSNHMGLSN